MRTPIIPMSMKSIPAAPAASATGLSGLPRPAIAAGGYIIGCGAMPGGIPGAGIPGGIPGVGIPGGMPGGGTGPPACAAGATGVGAPAGAAPGCVTGFPHEGQNLPLSTDAPQLVQNAMTYPPSRTDVRSPYKWTHY